jgi:hypothetical protein
VINTLFYLSFIIIYYNLNMFRNVNNNARWGTNLPAEELDLLARKDQQIRRLQNELEQEKRRADNSIKIL